MYEYIQLELLLAGVGLVGVGASGVIFLWQTFKEIDARIDQVEQKQVEIITIVEGHANDSREFFKHVQEWRDADRELSQSKFDMHWNGLQSLKELIVRVESKL